MEFATFFGGLAIVIACSSLVVGYRVLQFAQRSAPEELVKQIGALRVEVAGLTGQIQGVEGRVTSWRVEIENVLESVENVLETVERKRRSTAASASKINAAPNDVSQMDLRGLEQIARSRGLL